MEMLVAEKGKDDGVLEMATNAPTCDYWFPTRRRVANLLENALTRPARVHRLV